MSNAVAVGEADGETSTKGETAGEVLGVCDKYGRTEDPSGADDGDEDAAAIETDKEELALCLSSIVGPSPLVADGDTDVVSDTDTDTDAVGKGDDTSPAQVIEISGRKRYTFTTLSHVAHFQHRSQVPSYFARRRPCIMSALFPTFSQPPLWWSYQKLDSTRSQGRYH